MDLTTRIFNRQLNITDRQRPSKSIFQAPCYVPESSFDSLHLNTFYRFIDSYESSDSPPISLSLSNDKILIANDNGDIVLLKNRNLEEVKKFNAHNCAIFDIRWRPTNNYFQNQFLTCSGDKSITLWDINRHSILNIFQAHQGSVKSIAFYDSNVFASGGRDGSIKLWDLRSSNAMKFGPEFIIANPHICKLPSIKSPRLYRSAKSKKYNPIALASGNLHYQPSNVVTCVNFHPTNNYNLYSSGIADNSIKVWDIRRCRRQFQCSYTPMPVKHHTIKNCKSISSTNHGFSTFIFTQSKYGPILMASSTDNNIYAFTNSSVHPISMFSGRYSNHFTKISSFGEDYLLSGSINGSVYIWNSSINLPSVDTKQNKIVIENRRPIYELNFNEREDVSLVACDFNSKEIFCCGENQFLYKWSFLENKFIKNIDQIPSVPKCMRVPKEDSNEENCENRTINNGLKRSSTFVLSTTSTSQSSQTSTAKPLLSITNWLQNCDSGVKRLKSSSDFETPLPTKENSENQINWTTSSKGKRVTKSRKSRRSLFCNNRKISEFFTP